MIGWGAGGALGGVRNHSVRSTRMKSLEYLKVSVFLINM